MSSRELNADDVDVEKRQREVISGEGGQERVQESVRDTWKMCVRGVCAAQSECVHVCVRERKGEPEIL